MKYALITGAARGIGRACAQELAKGDWYIFVQFLSRKKEAGQVVDEIVSDGGKAEMLQGDVTSESDMEQVASRIREKTNTLDLLVNNAGIDIAKTIEEYSIDEMKRVVDVNLLGVMISTKAMLPLLKKSSKASIINISSRMGKEKVIPTVGAYAPAKAGVIKFTQCCALEFAPYRIRCNAVCPGLTDTELTRSFMTEQKIWDQKAQENPLGRVGTPEDIAKLVRFLASDDAYYINGEAVRVDGGSVLV